MLHSDIHASTWTILVADVIYNKAIFNGVITLIQSPSCNGPSPGEALSENDFDSPVLISGHAVDNICVKCQFSIDAPTWVRSVPYVCTVP